MRTIVRAFTSRSVRGTLTFDVAQSSQSSLVHGHLRSYAGRRLYFGVGRTTGRSRAGLVPVIATDDVDVRLRTLPVPVALDEDRLVADPECDENKAIGKWVCLQVCCN